MIEYRCAVCKWWLFSSDAPRGHVETVCRNRRCEQRQVVHLGDQPPPASNGARRVDSSKQAAYTRGAPTY